MLKEASRMMGHVGIANIALLHNLEHEAAINLHKALRISSKLEKQTAQLNADIMQFGKLKYHTPAGETRDYWLPVENDAFVVDNLTSEYLKLKEPHAAEEDAQLINTRVTLDTKAVHASLEKAAAALKAKNYIDAQLALLAATQSSISAETVRELPLVTAKDNLALAKVLVKSKDSPGAKFALNHAAEALADYQQVTGKEKSSAAATVRTEIAALQKEIAQDKPSVLGSIEKRIDVWIHRLANL